MVYTPKRNYQWHDDYRLKIDPNIVGGVLEQLEEENGGVTAAGFLDASRPEESPTHSIFEWDDDKAAESWRLHQSRTTINALKVTYVDHNGEEQKVSAYIKTSGPHTPTVYENLQIALSDKEKKAAVLDRIKRELESFIIRNSHIEELADILEEESQKLKGRRKK